MDDAHFPGMTEEEFPIEAPAPEGDKAPEVEPPKGDQPQPGEEAPKDDAPKDDVPKDEPNDTPETPLPKKRSVYDDLKDERKERKSAEARLKELEAENAELKAGKPADKPEPAPDAPADDLEAFAKEHEIDAKTLNRLVDVIAKRLPTADLSKEEREQLIDLKSWKEGKEAEDARAAEDREILGQSAAVKTQLDIHDDGELSAVMNEIVKLAHTDRYHDKEVDYIVFREREKLSKLVSPKKPSFEQGGQPGESEAPAEVEFSGKMTPATAQKAVESSYAKSGIEIRRGS